MNYIIHKILDWSEVWALLIPLAILLWKKNKLKYLRPVRIYLFLSLIVNLIIDLVAYNKKIWGLTPEDFWWNNNFLYNISSILRLLLFAWFFVLLGQHFMYRVKRIIPFAFLAFVLINFIFFEPFIPKGDYEAFSSRLLATEAAFLLFYCLQYFIFIIIEDKAGSIYRRQGFWFVTGLCIYAAVNFFIFLFYDYLIRATINFATSIWDVHNISFIVFCLFIAVQLNQKNE